MTIESPDRTIQSNKTRFWAQKALSVRRGIAMHQLSGQMTKDLETRERPWGNVTEHCLVETARAEVLGIWIGLPNTIISVIKVGAVLHDVFKKQEILATKMANSSGNSPLAAVNTAHQEGESLLKEKGFSDRVIKIASSAGGFVPQLIEAQRILDQETVSDEDWAYLIVHYIDDCSIGSDWVIPNSIETDGNRINIIGYRARRLIANNTYDRISQEVTGQLSEYPAFKDMDNIIAWSFVSHRIEQRLAKRILETTGETIDPLTIPELIDQKIREDIIGSAASKLSTT